ncbi:4867_t:CDS:2 [Acaulospora colombiana]|uniref:4867_t:CDS:1 n=1 Tax=Acaulospora colombiana TaxID=27376 RepID=A0ACA9LY45_9GLOM|nr:4867_t:CDS:2 [Acaulospora colombiana]
MDSNDFRYHEEDNVKCITCEFEYRYENIIPTDNISTLNEYEVAKTSVDHSNHEIEYRLPAVHPLVNPEKRYAFTVVSGASKNHFCPLQSWIYTMNRVLEGFDARIVVYDLGFTNKQRNKILKLTERGYITDFRSFNYSTYPPFWNISKARGEYGWKSAIMAEVARDYPGILIWLDSGTLTEREYFVRIPDLLEKNKGFISPRSQGRMERWTHPGLYKYYSDDHSKYDKYYNCNGASLAFNTYETGELIDEWYRCSLDKNCIAPRGSSRRNHRQDQSVLTYLAARQGMLCTISWRKFWMKTHQDASCKSIVKVFERRN